MEAGAGGRGGAFANAPPAAALGPEALHGLEFAHRQVGLLLDAMTRAIQRSNTTVSAGSSANTTPQKGDRHEGKVLQLARKFDGTPQDGGYLQYHQSRSPFGRRRDAADEREALLGIRSKLEVLQQRLESFISFPSAPSPAQASSAKPRDHLAEIDEARDELLWLALRKVDVVVRERTVLEAVIGFTRSGTIELEDGMDDLEHPIDTRDEEEKEREREDVVSLIHGASSLIWREKGQVETPSQGSEVGQQEDLGVAAGEGMPAAMASPGLKAAPRSPRRRIEWPESRQQQKQGKNKEGSPVSVLDASDVFAEKLAIDAALAPSVAVSLPLWPRRDEAGGTAGGSPIHPSKLSGDATARERARKERGEVERVEEEGDLVEEAGGEVGRGVFRLAFGLCKIGFRLAFRTVLVVAGASAVATVGAAKTPQIARAARAGWEGTSQVVRSRALVPLSKRLGELKSARTGRRAAMAAALKSGRTVAGVRAAGSSRRRIVAELPTVTVAEREATPSVLVGRG